MRVVSRTRPPERLAATHAFAWRRWALGRCERAAGNCTRASGVQNHDCERTDEPLKLDDEKHSFGASFIAVGGWVLGRWAARSGGVRARTAAALDGRRNEALRGATRGVVQKNERVRFGAERR